MEYKIDTFTRYRIDVDRKCARLLDLRELNNTYLTTLAESEISFSAAWKTSLN